MKRKPKTNAWPLSLLLLTLLLAGCANNSPQLPPVQLDLPPLPQNAKQPVAPSECSPSCLSNLTTWRVSSQQRLMGLE